MRGSACRRSRRWPPARVGPGQQRDAAALRRDEALSIPETLDYADIGGLSNELRGKLTRIRPQTLGQAGRIDGMTPAALALILTRIRQDERLRA